MIWSAYAVFHKFRVVHSWIPCRKCWIGSQIRLCDGVKWFQQILPTCMLFLNIFFLKTAIMLKLWLGGKIVLQLWSSFICTFYEQGYTKWSTLNKYSSVNKTFGQYRIDFLDKVNMTSSSGPAPYTLLLPVS